MIRISILRTTANHPRFRMLVAALDEELAITDGSEHDFYHQYNSIQHIRYAIVAYVDGVAVGIGAIKAFDDRTMEVKRMYTLPAFRGQGVASAILKALELWAIELGVKRLVLETGRRQPAAIALYEQHRFFRTPNYGQYIGKENSVCFEKLLDPASVV